jgi:hypothetical protein
MAALWREKKRVAGAQVMEGVEFRIIRKRFGVKNRGSNGRLRLRNCV